MKQSDKTRETSGQASPLPRFLRGLFRSQPAAPEPVAATVATGTVTLPQNEAVDEEPARVFSEASHSPKVLVVDDDPVVLKAMELKLSRAGCEVLRAEDGPAAIAIARTGQPDVILLDIGLPADVSVAWDGIRVMQWLKRMENGSAPPVIIMTASTSPILRENALAYGASAFFQKPVDHDALIAAITEALKQRKTPVASPPATSFY